MAFDKGHKEFHALNMDEGWHALPGYPPGIQEKIVAGALDEKGKRGNRTPVAALCAGHLHGKAVRARILGGGFSGVRRFDRRQ